MVCELSLRVPQGSIYGFLGPNGAGKTTTIRMLLGLMRPDHGEVRLFGLHMASQRKAILRKVGALFEEPAVYPHLTGRENLQVLTRLTHIRHSRIDETLRQVELFDAADKKVGQYSRGMKQRLGLAMALLNEPQLLILDEPTNGLDPAGIRDVRELLKRLAAEMGITVFLSSHLLSEIELVATHLGIINRGQLLFQGPLEELRRSQKSRTRVKTNAPETALEILSRESVRCALNGQGILEVDSVEPEAIANANQLLVNHGLRIYAIEPQSHRLEELFMQVTAKEEQ
ncbi:MAG TPA: ABC transporter ATP-binding protein [Candidatus Methylomirabilis sp.]|nr:ABC transporter ATP-binding protein [Candidatus Methylomirabilis sp.]